MHFGGLLEMTCVYLPSPLAHADEKGASVLRMLRAFLAQQRGVSDFESNFEKQATWQDDPFLAGLRTYLLTHSYGVATHTCVLFLLAV